MSRKLQNYLRTHRKRSGLSQDGLAFLLGCKSDAKVSRYEQQVRIPSLETIIMYEMIFKTDARELFQGISQKVEQATRERAKQLAEKLAQERRTPTVARKMNLLNTLIGLPSERTTDSV
jgi:transcriptional regulator with XRE-family HTH domain